MSLLDELKKRQMNGFAPNAPAPFSPEPIAAAASAPAPAVGPTNFNQMFPSLAPTAEMGTITNDATGQVFDTQPPMPSSGVGTITNDATGQVFDAPTPEFRPGTITNDATGQVFNAPAPSTGAGTITNDATGQVFDVQPPTGARAVFEDRIANATQVVNGQEVPVNPQINQADVSAANAARGRPINVSPDEVAMATQQAADRDLNSRADAASQEFGSSLSLGGRSIGERDAKIADFRSKFMAENAPSPADGITDFQKASLSRQDRAFDASQAAAATQAAGTQFNQNLATQKQEFTESQAAAKAAAGPAKTSTDRNIDRLMEANPDLSYSEAVNIEQGVVSKTVNPLTGATETTNIASGESTPVTSTVPLPDASLNLEPAAPGTSLFDRGQKFTGAIEAGLRAGQKVVGQVGGKIASDESVQTKKELDAFQGSLVRAFQEGDRFSTGQDKVLREELDATLGAMKDPETFKNNAIALDKVMRQRHADLIENYNDTTMDSDFRADSRAKARVLETGIRDLGVTQEAEGGATESAPLPEGINEAVTPEIWNAMTPEEQSVFQPKA